jgi:hypothetical protein
MSNYYKNTVKISEICHGTTRTDLMNSYYLASGLNPVTATFSNTVIETPSNLLYDICGTDVSRYCIASYLDSTMGNFNIPNWCSNIRAVLVGGGGKGGSGNRGTINVTNSNTNTNINLSANTNSLNEKVSLFTYQNNKDLGDEFSLTVSIGPSYNTLRVIQPSVGTTEETNISYIHFHDRLASYYNFNTTNSRIQTNTENYTLNVYSRDDTGYQQYRVSYARGFYNQQNIYNRETYSNENTNTNTNTQTTGLGGAGGGGGEFLYLDSINVQQKTVTISGGSSGHDTTLEITSNTGSITKYTAKKGGDATGNNVGTGATISDITNATSAIGNDGSSVNSTNGASGGTSGLTTYTTSLSYGSGGRGGDGGKGGENGGSGIDGQSGYYRIYFLTD